MNGLVRNVLSVPSGTTLTGSARLTNFNPNRILFVVDGGQIAPVKDDLKKINLTMNFKNSVGSGIAITANLPLDMIADMNDYLYGFGMLGSDKVACFVLDIGKYILKSDDEITFNISTSSALTNACSLLVKALDTGIGKERLVSYKYITASQSQAYQEANVMAVYAKIEGASDDVYMTVDDFYGSNNISEMSVVALGSALGSAEDMDYFGVCWDDPTGLTQPVTVRAGSSNERLLFRVWNFDVNRLGFARTDFDNVSLLAKSIADGNPSKSKCLKYFYG